MTGFRAGFFSVETWLVCAGLLAGLFIFLAVPLHRAAAVSSSIVIDSTITGNKPSSNGTTYTNVFISSSTGYAFYRDSDGSCVYEKTTDGGATWGTANGVGFNTSCIRVAVWYDQWTPGNTTGTYIHIATIETVHDDLYYTRLDTTNDTTSSILDISSSTQGGTYTAGATLTSIVEGTQGRLYAGVLNTSDSYVLSCSSNCTSFASWSEVGSNATWLPDANDWLALDPLPSGNILAVRFGLSSSSIYSKVWNNSSSTWDANWTTVDPNCPNNTTYDGHFGLAVNHNNNTIYMASACDIAKLNLSTQASIRTYTYTPASSTWVRDTDVETSSTLGITGAKIGLDINTGNIYVLYSGRSTKNTAATGDIYYKISTSTLMSNWGSRQGPINSTSGDMLGARIDGMSPYRLYATWVNYTDGYLAGTTVAVFAQNTYTESSYDFFQNQDSTQVGNQFAPMNASSLIPLAGGPFRLRMLIAVGGTGIDIDSRYFKLQYATSTAGGCDPSFTGETYVDVGTATSSAVSFYNNPTPANGDALTANGQDPTDGTNVIVNQTYVEQNNFSNDIAKVFGNEDGKWDFSLINNSGSPGATYCFRIVNADGSTLTTYNSVAEAQVDTAPTVTNVNLNGGNSITLIEGTTTNIVATGTVTDANGFADIYGVTGVAYRTTSGTSCTANPNDCYIGTGVNCSLNSCSGNSCEANCSYKFFYFAQPTDAGTPWSGDSWTTLIQASDTVFSGAKATSSPVQLLSLLAFETTSTINYGTFTQGQTMSTLTATSVIRSSGNVSMDMTLYGTNMTNGAFSIPVGQQHYATSSIAYGSGATLLANPGSTIDVNIPKPATSTPMPTSTLFWGISVPSGQMATVYTGYNSFVGVKNSLPWP